MSGGWAIGGVSMRGASHVRSGRPNQDAVRCLPSDGIGARVVGAVSDGHGAAAHFRSGIGAELAVAGAADILAWHLDAPGDADGDGMLAGEIVGHWREAVAAHLRDHPWTGDERFAPGGSYLLPYGATLVAFGATETMLVAVQIGDGDLLFGYPDGSIRRPLPSDEGLFGEETYSLCLDGAERRFRVATSWRAPGVGWPDFVMLSTDGISKSFRDDEAFEATAASLRRLAFQDWGAALAAFPEWLEQLSATGSGDDSTLCIAIRAGAGPIEGD